MVVENVQDLYLGPVGEPPVSDIGLPAFVGLLGAEPVPAGPGPFLRLTDHKPAPRQDPPDRGDRRHRGDAADLKVCSDSLGARVQTILGQLLTQPHDLVLHPQIDRVRIGMRAAGPRFERRLAVGLEAVDEFLHPDPGYSVLPGDFTLAPPLDRDGGDHEPGHRHGAPPS
jgi:hypothetical protein